MNMNTASSTSSHATKNRALVPTGTGTSKNKEDKGMTEPVDLHGSLAKEEDLESLHKKDPFLYYSIPGVREAELSLKEVDHSEVLERAHSVTRNTRVSFEQHSSLVMEDIFDDDELYGADDSNIPHNIDDLLSKLLLNAQMKSGVPAGQYEV